MKAKQRLIAQMVAGITFGVTTATLIAGGIIGVKEDLLRRDIENMEKQKIEYKDDSQIKQLDEKINTATAKREKYQDVLFPLVGTYLASGTACFTTHMILDSKQEKEKKQQEENLTR